MCGLHTRRGRSGGLELALGGFELLTGFAEAASDADDAAFAESEAEQRGVVELYTRSRRTETQVGDTCPSPSVRHDSRVDAFDIRAHGPDVLVEVDLNRPTERTDIHGVADPGVQLEGERGHVGDLAEIAAYESPVPVRAEHLHERTDRIRRRLDHAPAQRTDVTTRRRGHVAAVVEVSLNEFRHGHAFAETDPMSLPLQGRELEHHRVAGDAVHDRKRQVLIRGLDDRPDRRVPVFGHEPIGAPALRHELHALARRHVRPLHHHSVRTINREVVDPVVEVFESGHDAVAGAERLQGRDTGVHQPPPHLALPHPDAVALRGRARDVLLPVESGRSDELFRRRGGGEDFDLPPSLHVELEGAHGGVVRQDVRIEAVASPWDVDRVRPHTHPCVVFEQEVDIVRTFAVHEDGRPVHHQSPCPVLVDPPDVPQVRPVFPDVVQSDCLV